MLLLDLTADDEQCSTWDWPQISTDYNAILLKERRDSDVTQPANTHTHWLLFFSLIDINKKIKNEPLQIILLQQLFSSTRFEKKITTGMSTDGI